MSEDYGEEVGLMLGSGWDGMGLIDGRVMRPRGKPRWMFEIDWCTTAPET